MLLGSKIEHFKNRLEAEFNIHVVFLFFILCEQIEVTNNSRDQLLRDTNKLMFDLSNKSNIFFFYIQALYFEITNSSVAL